MDSTLRPRDIQARIRAGESPESVAAAAQSTVEKIMPYAGPVLAEREHMAQRAQRATVRRRPSEAGDHARTLGDLVERHLRSVNATSDSVEWDSYRREDNRWVLTALYETSSRSGVAEITFDPPGNYVVLDNDDARWLVGETPPTGADTIDRDDLSEARARRLGSVVSTEDEPLPLGADAIELVTGEPATPEPLLEPTPEPVADLPDAVRQAPAERTQDAENPGPPSGQDPDPVAEQEPSEPEAATEPPPTRRPVKKSRGRASVPSWDEIMFGGGKQD